MKINLLVLICSNLFYFDRVRFIRKFKSIFLIVKNGMNIAISLYERKIYSLKKRFSKNIL